MWYLCLFRVILMILNSSRFSKLQSTSQGENSLEKSEPGRKGLLKKSFCEQIKWMCILLILCFSWLYTQRCIKTGIKAIHIHIYQNGRMQEQKNTWLAFCIILKNRNTYQYITRHPQCSHWSARGTPAAPSTHIEVPLSIAGSVDFDLEILHCRRRILFTWSQRFSKKSIPFTAFWPLLHLTTQVQDTAEINRKQRLFGKDSPSCQQHCFKFNNASVLTAVKSLWSS